MQAQDKAKFKHSPTAAEKEATAALRAELQIELQNKKQCAYQPYECTQLTLDGYNYCLKHILNDKNAPFKQCCYVYTNSSKRCPQAAPKCDKKDFGYCSEHALKATLAKNRQNCRYPAPQTAEVLLHSLSHYVKKPKGRSSSVTTSASHQPEEISVKSELKATESLDPFTDIDVSTQLNPSSNDGLDLCSDSESDVDAATYSSVWHDAHADSSGDESIDSEQEDYLKHANIYTAEEITMVTREKLIRLQSLYIEQYRHLQYILKEHKRKYLHALKREKETCCNIYGQVRDNPKEQRLYKKLKALNKYHKPHGVEAILSKRAHELRNKLSEGTNTRSHGHSKCAFTEGGVKCGEKPLPLARYCRKHILEDPNQVLFRPCGKVRADVECNTPVEAIFDDSTCNLHMDIPNLRSYSQPRRDSDSDFDDSLETANIQATLAGLSTTCNVKTELIDFPSEIPKMSTVPTLLFEETSNSSDAKIKDETGDETFLYEGSIKSQDDQRIGDNKQKHIHFSDELRKESTETIKEEKEVIDDEKEIDVVSEVAEADNSKDIIDSMDIPQNEEVEICAVEEMETNIDEGSQGPTKGEIESDIGNADIDHSLKMQTQEPSLDQKNLAEMSSDFTGKTSTCEENMETGIQSPELETSNNMHNDTKINADIEMDVEEKGNIVSASTEKNIGSCELSEHMELDIVESKKEVENDTGKS